MPNFKNEQKTGRNNEGVKLSIKGCFIEAYVHIGRDLRAHKSKPLNNLSIFPFLLIKFVFVLVMLSTSSLQSSIAIELKLSFIVNNISIIPLDSISYQFNDLFKITHRFSMGFSM